MFLLDGVGDYHTNWQEDAEKDPDMRTTLQKAQIPVMDALCSQGVFGVHDPVQSGLACGSDTAHMSIFGYNPLESYEGRGVFEAMGAG